MKMFMKFNGAIQGTLLLIIFLNFIMKIIKKNQNKILKLRKFNYNRIKCKNN